MRKVDLSKEYSSLGFEKRSIKVGHLYLETYDSDRVRIWIDPLRDLLFQAEQLPYSMRFLAEFAESVDAVTVRPWYTQNMLSWINELGYPVLAESGGKGVGYVRIEDELTLEKALELGAYESVLSYMPLCEHVECWEEQKRPKGRCADLMNYVYTATGSLAELHKKLELAKPSLREVLRGRLRYFPDWWWTEADEEEKLIWFAEKYGTKHWLYPAVALYCVGRLISLR